MVQFYLRRVTGKTGAAASERTIAQLNELLSLEKVEHPTLEQTLQLYWPSCRLSKSEKDRVTSMADGACAGMAAAQTESGA